ncbi:MAG: outer membrane beta-barrel protein [Paludibacteraceae bacterium]|nr:outer membrane beta-barrel protein [Paludibacteraceae bacterium]
MKRSLLLIGILMIAVCAQAQHTFELGLHGGLAGYNSQHNYVSMQPGANVGFHAAYGYYSQHVIGFRIGVTADMHRAGWSKTDYTDTYTTIDVENETMQIDYTIGSLREMYTTWSVGIPAQIALKWKNVGFYLGPKVVFPLSCSWTEKAQNASLSVYYPDYDNRVYESYPLAASRSFAMDNNGKSSLPKMQWWLAGEISYDIPFRTYSKTKSGLTVGIYADYCLSRTNNTSTDLQPSLIMLTDTRDGFPLSRILSPVLSSQRQGQPLVSRYNLFDVGIKLSYTISPYNPRAARRNYPCRCYRY